MMSGHTKKLVNEVSQCVQESLEGLVAVQPGLCMLEGYPIVIREDINELKAASKVTLLSGGGSGHEPSHAGFVGRGMLSAAVAGAVFTSPPPQSILTAIRAIGHGNPAGTLLIVKNYTGDRLNFGIAAERAKAEGLKVAMVIVGEDCALMSPDKSAQRRGLCGTVLIHKIAGAMAERGECLEDIKRVVENVIEAMGTMGVCLYPCSVPGSGPSFKLGPSEVEIGLGIHGEAGIQRQEISPARELVASLVKNILKSLIAVKSVVLVINNLGGTSNLELTLVAKCAIECLQASGVVVLRAFCGTFMTSLEMAGVSITCVKCEGDSPVLKYLDDETYAPAWPRVCVSKTSGHTANDIPAMKVESQTSSETIDQGQPLPADVQKCVVDALVSACKALCEKETELNQLDSGCGDGDCGSTMKRGAEGILEWFSSHQMQRLTASQIAVQLAESSESKMGGSSGALYSIFFLAAATELRKGQAFPDLVRALGTAASAISDYGGASAGDRTMLDPLFAAHSILSESSSASIQQQLQDAAKAAEEASLKTASMKAQAGRASYVSSDQTEGRQDAGASAVACWIRAVADSYVL